MTDRRPFEKPLDLGSIGPGDIEREAEEERKILQWLQESEETILKITGEGEDATGHVRTRTDADGRVQEVVLDPRAMKLGSEDLAVAVLDSVARARGAALRQVRELIRDGLGSAPELIDEQFSRVFEAFDRTRE